MISHHHKTIFVHIPKCGGQSIEDIYVKELGLTWKNRAPLLLRKKADGEAAPPRLAHLTITQYLDNKYISDEIFDDYFKFSVVRNPYSRVISFYKYMGFVDKIGINEFIRDLLPKFNKMGHPKFWFFMPQFNFISNGNGEILVDEVLFLERLQNDWESKVLTQKNVNTKKVPRLNVSKSVGRDFFNELDASSRDMVCKIYELDFLSFGYKQ